MASLMMRKVLWIGHRGRLVRLILIQSSDKRVIAGLILFVRLLRNGLHRSESIHHVSVELMILAVAAHVLNLVLVNVWCTIDHLSVIHRMTISTVALVAWNVRAAREMTDRGHSTRVHVDVLVILATPALKRTKILVNT